MIRKVRRSRSGLQPGVVSAQRDYPGGASAGNPLPHRGSDLSAQRSERLRATPQLRWSCSEDPPATQGSPLRRTTLGWKPRPPWGLHDAARFAPRASLLSATEIIVWIPLGQAVELEPARRCEAPQGAEPRRMRPKSIRIQSGLLGVGCVGGSASVSQNSKIEWTDAR